jgi:hypothetical protein
MVEKDCKEIIRNVCNVTALPPMDLMISLLGFQLFKCDILKEVEVEPI